MNLPNTKISYTLDYIKSIIVKCPDMNIDDSYSLNTITFGDGVYTVKAYIRDKSIEELSINMDKLQDKYKIRIKNSEKLKSELSGVYTTIVEKIKEHENDKFLKVFPQYDISIDRDIKIEELLKETENEVVPPKEIKEIQVKKKRFWIF